MYDLFNIIKGKIFPTAEHEMTEEEYQRYVSSFVSPEKFQDRFGLDIENLHEYELVEASGREDIGGHHFKRFARIDRSYFPMLIQDLSESYPKNNYVTYLNEKDLVEQGLCPKELSILVKKLHNVMALDFLYKKIYNELLVPKILNFFDAKTVYNQVLVQNYEFYIFSIDFIKPDQVCYSLEDIDCGTQLNTNLSIKNTLSSLEERMKMLDSSLMVYNGYKNVNCDLKQIKKQFVYDYLVRRVLLGDRDFVDRNIGAIYDKKKNTLNLAPNFDFELAFESVLNLNLGYKKADLDYLFDNYYDEFSKFIKKLQTFLSVDKECDLELYKKLILQNVPNQDVLEIYMSVIEQNGQTILSYFNEKEKQSGKSQKS